MPNTLLGIVDIPETSLPAGQEIVDIPFTAPAGSQLDKAFHFLTVRGDSFDVYIQYSEFASWILSLDSVTGAGVLRVQRRSANASEGVIHAYVLCYSIDSDLVVNHLAVTETNGLLTVFWPLAPEVDLQRTFFIPHGTYGSAGLDDYTSSGFEWMFKRYILSEDALTLSVSGATLRGGSARVEIVEWNNDEISVQHVAGSIGDGGGPANQAQIPINDVDVKRTFLIGSGRAQAPNNTNWAKAGYRYYLANNLRVDVEAVGDSVNDVAVQVITGFPVENLLFTQFVRFSSIALPLQGNRLMVMNPSVSGGLVSGAANPLAAAASHARNSFLARINDEETSVSNEADVSFINTFAYVSLFVINWEPPGEGAPYFFKRMMGG